MQPQRHVGVLLGDQEGDALLLVQVFDDLEHLFDDLRNNEDVKEFYLGMGGTERKSFKDVKSYKRRKRWLA